MKTTSSAKSVQAKIGRTSAGPGGGVVLLQLIVCRGGGCEVASGDYVCQSEQCRSWQVVGASSAEVAE